MNAARKYAFAFLRNTSIALCFAVPAFFMMPPDLAVAATCGVFERLNGSWSGKGRAKRNAKAGREAVRCRFRFNWSTGSTRLGYSISCHGVDGGYSSSGSVTSSGRSLRGSASGSLGSAAVRGSCSSSSVSLRLSGKSSKTGKTVRSRVSISVSGSRLTSNISASDPESGRMFQALSASLKK